MNKIRDNLATAVKEIIRCELAEDLIGSLSVDGMSRLGTGEFIEADWHTIDEDLEYSHRTVFIVYLGKVFITLLVVNQLTPKN